MITARFGFLAALCAACSLLCALPAQAVDSVQADLVAAAGMGPEAARVKALLQIAELGPQVPGAVPALTKMLSEASPAIKAHAALALGKMGVAAKPAAPQLVELLKDSDAEVRRQAVVAITAIKPGPEVMIPLMVKLLEDADPGVRLRILQAVSTAGPAAVPGLIKALEHEKAAYWACLVLREIGPAAKDAVPALVKKLHVKQPEIRREAALTIAAIGGDAAVADLAMLVGDEHAGIAATFALGQIGKIPPNVEAKVRANCESQDQVLSTVSYWALARVHPKDKTLRAKATEALVTRLMEKDPFVRVAAARALATLEPAPEIAIPILEKALQNADAETVLHALDAFAALGPAALPRLKEALKHGKLQAQVCYIIGQMGPAAASATEELAKLVASSDPRVANEAAHAIAKIGPGAKAAVPALIAALQAQDSPNAHAAAYALGAIGKEAAAATPALGKAVGSDDASLAVISAGALYKISPTENVAKAVLPALIGGLLADDPVTRHTAVDTIGSMGPLAKVAAGALKETAERDSDPAVREAATAALKAVGGA